MTKILRLYVVILVLASNFSNAADEEEPRCHVYIDKSGWVASDIDRYVKAKYSTENICESVLSSYPCYSYFESKEKCTVQDKSLVELFKRDARDAGQLID